MCYPELYKNNSVIATSNGKSKAFAMYAAGILLQYIKI